MSNLTRWEPVSDWNAPVSTAFGGLMTLREAMDRLFDDAFTRPMHMYSGVMPAIDLYQNDNEVVVKAALPGVKPGEVQLSVTADVLTLRGEFKQQSKQKDANYHIQEQRYGAFERSVMLPAEVQTDKAKAEFENGILTITLPKAESLKPRTINIKVN